MLSSFHLTVLAKVGPVLFISCNLDYLSFAAEQGARQTKKVIPDFLILSDYNESCACLQSITVVVPAALRSVC